MSSHRTPKFALIALSLLLGACSFQFQAGVGSSNRSRARARQAARPTATTAKAPVKTTTTTPTKTTTPTTPTPTAVEPPRITGRIAFGNGSIGAFKGYAYVIPNTTTTMPDLAKLVPFASLLTDSFIVQPQEFTSGFPGVLMQDEWFAIQYNGRFDIKQDNTYMFRLVSDDGAILYIDGEKIIDNDGIHNPKTQLAQKVLRAGRHTLRLDYFQGARGPVALSLGMGVGASTDVFPPLVGIR